MRRAPVHRSFGVALGIVLSVVAVGCAERHGGEPDAPTRPRPPEPPPGAVVCGGGICADGEECCLLTASCVPIGDPSCVVPSGTAPGGCARASDCDDDEVCTPADIRAGGRCGAFVGRCAPETECGFGTAEGWCGCDGRTYADPCDASAAGTLIAFGVPCGTPVHFSAELPCEADADCGGRRHYHCDEAAGVCAQDDPLIACGIDAQCPDGQRCCGITGFCVDPARAGACVPPVEGNDPCADDSDCQRLTGAWWLDRGSYGIFCDGPGCSGPGSCVSGRDCDGVLDPACGCDGRTYTNACEVRAAGVRLASTGACPE